MILSLRRRDSFIEIYDGRSTYAFSLADFDELVSALVRFKHSNEREYDSPDALAAEQPVRNYELTSMSPRPAIRPKKVEPLLEDL